ncbi:MAG: PAS domain-containing sensor histidine kinase [Thermoanaerobaculia bacterium]
MRTEVERPARAVGDRLFRLLVGAIRDYSILLLDPDGRIASWDQGAERLQGYATGEVVGQPFSILFTDADRGRGLPDEVLRLATERGCWEGEAWRVRRDGTRFWAHIETAPMRDDDGRLVGFAEVTDDRSREREAERNVRESEERYRLLADMIPQHIWTTEPDGYHNYFSRRWYDFTGTTPEQTQGEGWLELLHPDDRERTLARWQHSLRTGEPYAIEYRFRGVDGDYRWFLGQAVPQRSQAGDIIRWFGTLTDITDRRELDEERDRLLARERAAREQITTMLESITDAFFAVDREWRFTYINREGERVLQRSREELLGQNVWNAFPKATDSAFYREYHRAVGERKTVRFEEYYEPLGIWVDVLAYPAADGLSVFFRDVTDRRRAEEDLRASERNFRALANSIPQLAWMAAPSGWIFWYNDRWYEYTGTTIEEMQGWGWRYVHHPEHVDRVVERIRHAFETGRDWEDTFPLRSKTGEYRWVLSRAVPIKDAQGNVVRWFGTNTDITESMEAAAERERLLERERQARSEADRERRNLEGVTESRARLMRGFTHDVKNPIGAADGNAQLLEGGMFGELSEGPRDSVQRIRHSLRASLRLIEDLLDLAQAEAGQIRFERASTDVGQAARDVAKEFEAQASAAGLALDVRAPDDLHTDTDPTRLRQILANLLSNAVKYTPQGRVTVDADARRDGDAPRPGEWIVVSVTDTGPGIPADKREQIFLEFTRLEPEAQPGSGVGLAISRRIARLLGGDITVESEIGGGSTFTLWLPRAPQ